MADSRGTTRDNAQPEGKSKQEDKSRPVDTVKPEGGAKPTGASKSGAPCLKPALLSVLKASVAAGLLFVLFMGALFVLLPLPEPSIPEATRIYDVDGKLVLPLRGEPWQCLTMRSQNPQERRGGGGRQAVFLPQRIDLNSIARALLRNLGRRGG